MSAINTKVDEMSTTFPGEISSHRIITGNPKTDLQHNVLVTPLYTTLYSGLFGGGGLFSSDTRPIETYPC